MIIGIATYCIKTRRYNDVDNDQILELAIAQAASLVKVGVDVMAHAEWYDQWLCSMVLLFDVG